MTHGARAMTPQRFGTAERLKRGLCLLLSLALVTLGVTFAPAPAVAIAPPMAFDDPEAMQKLLAADGAAEDQLGDCVSIDGNTAIVGAPYDDDRGIASGAAYVFTRSGGVWTEQAKLTAAVGADYEYFGSSVALSGDTVMIGASGANGNGGCVYVFTRSDATWTEQAILTAADGEALDGFGTAVALSGDTAVFGAIGDDDQASDAGAAYVFTGSGAVWTQQAKLTGADGRLNDRLGSAVAVSGDTVVIGSYYHDDKGVDSGSAYVFTRSGSVWTQQAELTAADGEPSENFGAAIALDGDTALIAAWRDGEKGGSAGAAYVFTRSENSWSQQAKLTAADGVANDFFGISVALNGNTALIGSYGDDDKGANSGSAYVFAGSGATWTQKAKLTAADGADQDRYGVSVALNGNTAVIGTYGDDDKASGSGSAYIGGLPLMTRENTPLSVPAPGVLGNDSDPMGEGLTAVLADDASHGTVGLSADGSFTYTPDAGYGGQDSFTYTASDGELTSAPATVTITVEAVNDAPLAVDDPTAALQKVLASDGKAEALFGTDVSIDGDTAVIGAWADDEKGTDAGAAYVFIRTGSGWKQQAKLTAADAEDYHLFGGAVSVSGDTIVIGVRSDDEKGNGAGAAYVFTRTGTVWTQQAKLTAADWSYGDAFGTAVALSGDTVVIGAPEARYDEWANGDSGSAYVFTRTGDTWTQQAKLSDRDFGEDLDRFGYAVALDGDTAVIGAYQDDGNSGQLPEYGSAYVYTRTDGVWTQQTKLWAEDRVASGAMFGIAVAVSGDTAVIGAVHEDVEGEDSGAAYVFTRTGTAWTRQAWLTASDSGGWDWFGREVAISGDTVVIGAPSLTGSGAGAAYVFTRAGDTWTEQAKLEDEDGWSGENEFGCAVAVSDDTALIGAWQDDVLGVSTGSAYFAVLPYDTDEDTPLSIVTPGLLVNDSDPDGDPLTTALVSDALNGAVAPASDGSFTYTPDPDFFGTDTFTYRTSDGELFSEPATVTILVKPVNDAPAAADDAYLVAEDSVLTTTAPGVLVNDSDREDDPLTATLVSDAVNGSVFLTSNGSFTYRPDADFFGTDTFTYCARDGELSSEPATVTITVTATDDAPVALDDPAAALQKVLASDGTTSSSYGFAASIDGDTAVIGAKGENSGRGSAYVFTRSGGTWTQQAKLIAADGAASDLFGYTVAVSGDTVVIGASGDDSSKGSAYVFTRSDGVWTQQAKLKAADGVAGDTFGLGIALSGDTAVIGACVDDDKGTDSGSAYVFTRSGTVWTQQAKLTAADGAAGDYFGYAAAVSGDTVVIGARLDDDKGLSSGSAYVFTRSGTAWTQQAKLTAADGAASDYFGFSVALSGDTVVIGARLDDDKGLDSGSAYVFTRSGTAWTQQAKLKAADGASSDYYGTAVSIDGDVAVIGASGDDSSKGSGYVFTRSGTAWTQQAKLTAADGAASDYFGYAVAISGDAVVIGAYGDDDAGTTAGSAYFETLWYTTDEGMPISIAAPGLLANDIDPDGDDVTAEPVTDAINGTVSLASDGSFTYTPDADFSGFDTFTYRVTDGEYFSTPAVVTINVMGVNDAPVAADDAYLVAEDSVLTTAAPGVLANDTDPEGDLLTATVVADVVNGTLALAPDGSFTYTPDADFFGTDTFTYRAHDGEYYSNVATVTIAVTDVNETPVLEEIGDKSVSELTELTFTATATDPDGGTLAYSLDAGAPAGAAIDSATGGFTWTPTDAQGPDTYDITITVDDGTATDSETITVTVSEVNVAPVLAAIGDRTIGEGSESTFTVTATDADLPANTLTYSLDTSAPAGAEITSAGVFSWTPTEAQGPGTYTFGVEVSDGTATDSDTITVTVAEVNAAPVLASIGDKTVEELDELSFTATATDADLPANTLTYNLDASAPAGAAIDSTTGDFTWTPTEAQGPDTYDITVTVDDGTATDSETITVTVSEVNVAPVLAEIGDQTVEELDELSFTASATDADLPANTLTYSLDTSAPAGAEITSAGVFSWTPTEAQGPDTYTFGVEVSDGTATDSETITVTVTEANVAPVLDAIGDRTIVEGSELGFTATATDADLPANTLAYSLGEGAPAGAAISAGGVFTWTPTLAQVGEHEISVTVGDGAASDAETITVTVTGKNATPVLTSIGDKAVDELDELTFSASATDADVPVQALAYSLDASAPVGAAIDSTTGDFTWTPTEAQGPGSYDITVTVDDGTATDSETITVTVTEANVAPVLAGIGDMTITEGSELTFTSTATDADLPVNTLAFSLDASAPAGAAITAGGVFTWTPTEAQGPGSYTFKVEVSDGTLADSESITVTVAEVNVAPVLAGIGDMTITEGSELTFTSSATDADLPANTLAYSLGEGAPAGAAITAGGVFAWTPAEAQGPGVYDITVTVSDGALSDSESITVTVAEVNVAPVLVEIGNKSIAEGSELAFSATATDADLPANTLTYSLGEGAPAGAAITAGGFFTWTPTDTQVGAHDITITVSDGEASASETITVTVTAGTPVGLIVTPVAGAGRVDTAIEASRLAFSDGSSEYVLIASARMFPDAISGSALAGVLDAPLLLTEPGTLNGTVKAEIARLGASRVVVLGGTGAVSADVYAALDALPGVTDVERIFGSNRYETAQAIAERVIAEQGSAWSGRAFVATGEDFPDALGASSVAAAKGWPVYLAQPSAVTHDPLVATMVGDGVTSVVILGGTGVVPAALETKLIATFGDADVDRLYGANRYETAVAVATYGVTQAGLGWDHLAIATGEDFPDALAGGALQGASDSVMLLVHPGYLHGGVQTALSVNKATITEVRFLGGTGVVPAAIRAHVVQLLQ